MGSSPGVISSPVDEDSAPLRPVAAGSITGLTAARYYDDVDAPVGR